MVSASTGSRPPTVEIKVKDSDPVLAYTTADKVAEEFIDYVVELRLAEIGRLQTAAVAQGLSNVPGLISAQYGLIDSLTILEPPPFRQPRSSLASDRAPSWASCWDSWPPWAERCC